MKRGKGGKMCWWGGGGGEGEVDDSFLITGTAGSP